MCAHQRFPARSRFSPSARPPFCNHAATQMRGRGWQALVLLGFGLDIAHCVRPALFLPSDGVTFAGAVAGKVQGAISSCCRIPASVIVSWTRCFADGPASTPRPPKAESAEWRGIAVNGGIVSGAPWDTFLGAGPRAEILLQRASKALAVVRVRGFGVRPTPTPVIAPRRR